MAAPTTPKRSTRSRSSTRSRRSGASGLPPEVAAFARFCAALTLEDGSALELHEFQRVMLADYFGGATETLVLIPKKNGKSTLMAALALYHLLITPDAECVIAAASRDQAAILFGQASGFVRRSEGLQRRMRPTMREIRSLEDAGRIRVLASDVDTADGVIPTLALVDELHRHKSADLYGVFRDGLGPRDGRMITISTAGDDELSPLGRMRAAAYSLPGMVRDGAYRYARSRDGAYVMHEWALDPDEDRENIGLVASANPAPWQDVDALSRRFNSPSMTPWQWARFACGVWMQGEDTAISPLEWGKAARASMEIPRGEPVALGIDLGWKWDTTAIVPLWKSPEGKWLFGRPWIVEPPRNGTSTPVDAVFGPVKDAAALWNVQSVVLDPSADGEHLAQRIEGELGLSVVSHSQKAETMCLAAQRFTSALRDGQLEHCDDLAFTAQVLAAVPKQVPGSDRWRFVKKRQPIDSLIAAAMVLSVSIAEPPKREPLIAWR